MKKFGDSGIKSKSFYLKRKREEASFSERGRREQ